MNGIEPSRLDPQVMNALRERLRRLSVELDVPEAMDTAEEVKGLQDAAWSSTEPLRICWQLLALLDWLCKRCAELLSSGPDLDGVAGAELEILGIEVLCTLDAPEMFRQSHPGSWMVQRCKDDLLGMPRADLSLIADCLDAIGAAVRSDSRFHALYRIDIHVHEVAQRYRAYSRGEFTA